MSSESLSRMVNISFRTEEAGIGPNEFIKQKIINASSLHNPLLNPDDTYVVMGIDGFDFSIFPCMSFNNPEDARNHAIKMTSNEYLYSDDPEISTTFHVFTTDGIHVPIDTSQDR